MNKDKIGLLFLPLVIAILLYLLIRVVVYSTSPTAHADEPVYKVVQVDDEGYFYACRAVKAEDGTYVPLSYYGKDDDCVAYDESNVVNVLPRVNDLVRIHISRRDDAPIVTLAKR